MSSLGSIVSENDNTGVLGEITALDMDATEIPQVEVVKKKMLRMKMRIERTPYLIYPEDAFSSSWELWITIILLYTCMATPYRIAFVQVDSFGWKFQAWFVDIMFLIDIFINFNTAYQDEDFITVDDRKSIAKTYLSGWFLMDALSIFPFDWVV